MRHQSLSVLWSLHKGIEYLQINNSSHRLTRANLKIRRRRRIKNFFRRSLEISITYHGEIIHTPLWNERLIRKIFLTGERMAKTQRQYTIIEGIQINYRYIP